MSDHSETVTRIITDAIMKATHPDAHLLILADGMTTPGKTDPLPPGASRKMSRSVAHAAMTAVTRMMRRHGLKPSEICREAKVANQRNDYFKFHLTREEMDPAGVLVGPLPATREVRQGLGPFVRMVRVIAGKAGVPEVDLLQELGRDVTDFLAPFAAADKDPWDLLHDDIALLATYFGKVREGTDGEQVDVRRYFTDAVNQGVSYSPGSDRMMVEPEEPTPDAGFWQAPSVPLFVKTVAVGVVDCLRHEGMVATSLGEMKVNVVEVYHLAIVPAGKGLRAVLFAEPWTATFGTPGDGRSRSFGDGPVTHFIQGTPFSGGLRVPEGDDFFGISFVDDKVGFGCEDFQRHLHGLLASAQAEEDPHGAVAGYYYEAVNYARRIDLDAEALKGMLAHQSDEKWRTLLRFLDAPPAFVGAIALPRSVELTGGETSDALAERLKEALLGDGQAIVRGLTEAATRRARAMDAFMSERIDAERWRRERYRRRMRA